MNGELSQLITLCSAVNGHLAGRFPIDQFFPTHVEFRFCNSVTFLQESPDYFGHAKESQVACDPNVWIKDLSDSGAKRAFLCGDPPKPRGAPEHILVSFANSGGPWFLCITYADRTDRWISRWDGIEPRPSDDNVWAVRYMLVDSLSDPLATIDALSHVDLHSVTDQLLSALTDVKAFCVRHYLDGFEGTFQRAMTMLTSHRRKSITFPDHVDFVCFDSYPEQAQRLLAASYCAWVFGGMGSWNDTWFAEPDTYNEQSQVSKRLLAAINAAVQNAVNSFVMT